LNVEVELLPASAAEDGALTAELRERINNAYAEAEAELWEPGFERIALKRVVEIVAAGEMAVAWADGRIVGSVRVRRLDETTGFFGLLAVDPADQGAGVGRELVRFAEELSRERGATHMELRLLVPRMGDDAHKGRLHVWYSRLGYRPVGRADFSAAHPDAASRMPLDILTYRKLL
jgi:GNAT superfamily N-acetyltransferase